jgi:hypothetical protein
MGPGQRRLLSLPGFGPLVVMGPLVAAMLEVLEATCPTALP